jgi:hypothetical protein
MYSVRASFDSYFYWGVFIFVSVFMGYFLVSMISLANAEEVQTNRTMYIGYAPRSSYLNQPATVADKLTEEEF